jgi:ATP synthase protein I
VVKRVEAEGEDRALRERLDKLSGDIAAQRSGEGAGQAGEDLTGKGAGQAINLGFRVLTEFVSAIAVGTFIGWLLDRVLGTSPFLLIIFLMLGMAAGLWTIYRIAMPAGQGGKTK